MVTGGNAGFGLAIVNEFVGAGANVVCVSRTGNGVPESVVHVSADVTDDQSVAHAVSRIVEAQGAIDVWINNVGKSTRTSFKECSIEDYRELMEMNFYTAVRCSLAVISHLEKTSGTIVQIGSLASKTGWKHIAPYVTSKHALAGFAHQLRMEGPNNVHSLFVCPGPIRREDAGERYNEKTTGLGEAAAAPGAGAKVSGIEPDRLASKVRIAIEHRKSEIVVPWKSRLLFSILQMSPRWGDWLLSKFSK